MRNFFGNKVIIGFISNILVLVALGLIYFVRTRGNLDTKFDKGQKILEYGMDTLVIILLLIVFFIMRSRIKIKIISQQIDFKRAEILQSFFDNSPNPMSVKNNSGDYLMTNKKHEAIFKMSTNKTGNKSLSKENTSGINASDYEVVRGGKEIIMEETIVIEGKSNTYFTVKFPLVDQYGKNYAVGTILNDVSDIKITETSMKYADRFFEMSLDILVVASKDSFVKINPSLSKTLGYSEKELLENSFLTFVQSMDVEKTKNEILKLESGVSTIDFENRWVCKGGSIKLLRWTAVLDVKTGLLYAIAHDITEDKLTENQLKETTVFLSTVLDNIPNMIFVKDAKDLRFLKLNKAGEILLGVDSADVIGKNDYEIFPKEEAEFFTNKDREVLNKKVYIDIAEEAIDTKNGRRWLHTQKMPVLNEMGEALYLIGISEDITERKKNEETLKVADRFFNMSYDILVVAKGEYFVKVNQAFTRILGYEQNEMDNKPFLTFVHPDDVEKSRRVLKSIEEGESFVSFKSRARCKDGSFKCLDWSITSDTQSGLIYAVARDISEQVKMERSFYKAYKFFNMSNEIFVIEKGDNFVKFNHAFTKILGYHESEAEKLTPMNLTHQDDLLATKNEMAKIIAGEALVVFKERVLCMDGSYKWIEWSATAEKQTGVIYMIGRDITVQVENKKSLQIADKFFNMAFEMLLVGDEKHFIKINPAVTSTLGYNQEEMNTINFIDLTHPEDLQITKDQLKKLLEGLTLVSYKSRVRCKNESYKWIHWSITSDLNLKMIYAVARDITEQIKLEEEQLKALNLLNENEEKLKLILENIGDGVIVANPDNKILLANYMANEIFEIEENETISFHFSDHFEIYFPDETTVFPAQNLPMTKALNGEITEDIDIVLWNPVKQIKKRILVSGRPLVDQNNKVVAAVITIKDISKYKQLEEELKESESKYRQLIGFKKNEK